VVGSVAFPCIELVLRFHIPVFLQLLEIKIMTERHPLLSSLMPIHE